MPFDNSGLRRLQENLREASPSHVPLTEILSPAFMRSRTPFESFEAMLNASPLKVETAEDLTSAEWNAFIRKETPFDSWEAMQLEGGVEWKKAKLLKGL